MTDKFKEFIISWFNDKLFAGDVVANPERYPNLVHMLHNAFVFENDYNCDINSYNLAL